MRLKIQTSFGVTGNSQVCVVGFDCKNQCPKVVPLLLDTMQNKDWYDDSMVNRLFVVNWLSTVFSDAADAETPFWIFTQIIDTKVKWVMLTPCYGCRLPTCNCEGAHLDIDKWPQVKRFLIIFEAGWRWGVIVEGNHSPECLDFDNGPLSVTLGDMDVVMISTPFKKFVFSTIHNAACASQAVRWRNGAQQPLYINVYFVLLTRRGTAGNYA